MVDYILPRQSPNPGAALGWDGTDFRVVTVDAAGNLQVDVVSPDGLAGALQSVATDRLIVRGEDQLFSFKDEYHENVWIDNAAAGNNTILGSVVPVGDVWVITSLLAYNETSACTRIHVGIRVGVMIRFLNHNQTCAVYEAAAWTGWVPMCAGNRVQSDFVGCVLNDNLSFHIHGFKMTKET